MLLLMYQIMLFVSKKDLKLKYHTIYDSLFSVDKKANMIDVDAWSVLL